MRVRPAVDADAGAIASTIVAAGQAAWTEIFDTSSLAVDADRWLGELRTPGVRFWVGLDEAERVRGFSAVGPATDPALPWCVGELLFLHVHPDAWGTGLGLALHDAALDGLRAVGCAEVRLRTEERNHRAIAFYLREGWRPDGEVLTRTMAGSTLREPWLRKPLGVAAIPVAEAGFRFPAAELQPHRLGPGAALDLDAEDHARLVVPLHGEAHVTASPSGPRVALTLGHAGYVPRRQPARLASDLGAVVLDIRS